MRAVPYREPGERARSEYRLTRKGVDLLPVMISLMQWGDRHLNDGREPVSLFDRVTGEPLELQLRSASGRQVEPHEIDPRRN